jgi:hypothetical protein
LIAETLADIENDELHRATREKVAELTRSFALYPKRLAAAEASGAAAARM